MIALILVKCGMGEINLHQHNTTQHNTTQQRVNTGHTSWKYFMLTWVTSSQTRSIFERSLMTTETQRVNSLRSGDAYKCLWTGSPLDQMMACCLISSKPFIWTNVGILSIGPLETNFSEILIKIQIISFKERYLKLSTAKWWPFWLSLNVLKLGGINSTSQIVFSSWGKHGAHLGPVGPRWAPCWPHEPCHQGCFSSTSISWVYKVTVMKDQFTCTTANRDKIAFASLKILFVIPVLHIFWYALFGAKYHFTYLLY